MSIGDPSLISFDAAKFEANVSIDLPTAGSNWSPQINSQKLYRYVTL